MRCDFSLRACVRVPPHQFGLQLYSLLDGQIARSFADLDTQKHQNQTRGRKRRREPEGNLVTLPRPSIFRLAHSQVCETQEDGNTKEQQTVHEGARQTLSILGHRSRQEDVADVVCNIDSKRGADHCREYISPVVEMDWKNGE